jgi:hypothetical protein
MVCYAGFDSSFHLFRRIHKNQNIISIHTQLLRLIPKNCGVAKKAGGGDKNFIGSISP